MPADPAYLRSHFGSLSDEALLDIDRADLVEAAQRYYDEEVIGRGLDPPRRGRRPDGVRTEEPVSDEETAASVPDSGEEPPWMDDAAEVYSGLVHCRRHEEGRIAEARQVLDAAGIPCHLELAELPPEEQAAISATHRWRLLVPGKLGLQAMSTLERDLSNPDFEAGWRAHLEACSDRELPGMHPEIVFCGLFDRIDRVTRVYREEMARRGIKMKSR